MIQTYHGIKNETMYKSLILLFKELLFSKVPDSSIKIPNSLILALCQYIKNGEEIAPPVTDHVFQRIP